MIQCGTAPPYELERLSICPTVHTTNFEHFIIFQNVRLNTPRYSLPCHLSFIIPAFTFFNFFYSKEPVPHLPQLNHPIDINHA